MNIFVVNAHWHNRGDEAAIRAMIDQIVHDYPEAEIFVHMPFAIPQFPYDNNQRVNLVISPYPKRKSMLELPFTIFFKGKILFFNDAKLFCKAVKNADLVIHAPGGPGIGDIYAKDEWRYLVKLFLVIWFNKPLFFYAPSMGPFRNKFRNIIRRFILNRSKCICLREGVSQDYLGELRLRQNSYVTLDSAIQSKVDINEEMGKLEAFDQLKQFLATGNIIGITITDLTTWHPQFKGKTDVSRNIDSVFKEFINYLVSNDYKILFIPQQFGIHNDRNFMLSFVGENKKELFCDVSDECDAYFQQFIISRLYAVVGMRYHSNIFAAKMSVPFVSVAYEQKMLGFMKKAQLEDYCININNLTTQQLITTFDKMTTEYQNYKNKLVQISESIRREASKTQEHLDTVINNSIKTIINS